MMEWGFDLHLGEGVGNDDVACDNSPSIVHPPSIFISCVSPFFPPRLFKTHEPIACRGRCDRPTGQPSPSTGAGGGGGGGEPKPRPHVGQLGRCYPKIFVEFPLQHTSPMARRAPRAIVASAVVIAHCHRCGAGPSCTRRILACAGWLLLRRILIQIMSASRLVG